MNKEKYSEFDGVSYAVACFDWPNGWLVEVRVEGLPNRREGKLFGTYEEAHSFGEDLAKRLIVSLKTAAE
ncbi:hypothetical protein NNO07_18810 [Pseudomonas resinovorans]|uniref:Uncharacterized protein n=1 Tax=Metapseudomonas resinovorans TaxID=53412 RepID=A0ABT4Y8B9_METRE|nr:hypothetical protein [Pseudomonas resinovorans]MDA8485122.1 hypothetical protein [Pseudomonas resinovorans]